ncbi:hypothetical protein M9Y10_013326 [Tritrichomonas musculus]|uniref:Uncharacterized protein n=1 Tax=Tritrichomonas musculus TaxID=1915356 RepID=A0ABR2I738_9EUKA
MNSKIHNNIIVSFKKIFYDLSFQRKKQNFIVETFDLIQALHLSSLINFLIDAHVIMIMILNKLVDINCLDPVSLFLIVSKIKTTHVAENNLQVENSETNFSVTVNQKLNSSLANELMILENFSDFIDTEIYKESCFIYLPKILMVHISRSI